MRPPAGVRGGTRTAVAGRDRWLLSYADFITLLLALFVVLYASARLDAERSETLRQGLESAFAPARVEPRNADRRRAAPEAETATTLRERLEETLVAERSRRGSPLGAHLQQDARGLVLSLASTDYFPSGGAEIAEDRKPLLAAIAPLLAASDGPLLIEGHTDDQPIRSELFPSNWELSAARAAAVARYLIENHGLAPERFTASGHAEFRPIASNVSERNRARNRRVEIVLGTPPTRSPGPRPSASGPALDRLLQALPPLPAEPDEGLRARETGAGSQTLPPP